MSEATPRFSGFFTRRKNNESISHARNQSTELHVPRIERTSVEDNRPVPAKSPTASGSKAQRVMDVSEPKSFFRIPRRKKASSLTKSEVVSESTDRISSTEQTRHSSQMSRFPFDNFLRPSLSLRYSTGNISSSNSAGNALVAASASLAVQGSPSMELTDPMDNRTSTRPQSTRSVKSYRSTHSTPASDRSNGTGENATKLQNRGRSRTYAGESPQKATNSRSSKFFSMGRLLREPDDNSLFRPLSRELSPNPSTVMSAKVEAEKPASPVLPGRIDGESPSQFLARVEARMPKTLAASVLAASDDSFHYGCLQLYMQQFNFVQDPLDIALRKFLMDTHLPKETQQIDRVLNAFSARYQVCNPRLYDSAVTPYVLSFALIMLHTDRFNQNNKYKMTKAQFLKNTSSEHTENVSSDVLEYFYDNIVSTPFILVEDEFDSSIVEYSNPTTPNEIQSSRNGSTSALSMNQHNGTFGRRSLDLYPLIMENKLDTLRPQLGPILENEHVMAYTGSLPIINVAKLHNAFTHPATLQLVSPRSRPEAFLTDHSIQNPLDTDPGLVDIQITKIGVLRRKEQKKPGSKPVYREWGVMLTPSQLLLFKNVAWVKHYMHQARDHASVEPLILTPAVQNFAPDSYMPMSDTVAMWDSSISKKSTHFCFFGRGGEQTHLIASSEEEMNDWVAKINYAAAFHTVGIRIRGTNTEQRRSDAKRLRHQSSVSTVSTLSGSLLSQPELVSARQKLLRSKIKDMDGKVTTKEIHLALLHQHGRNLCTLTPIQPRTRASVIQAAGSLSAKLSWARMELVKTQCHRDILAKDLELEMDPTGSAFTAPIRSSTPPPSQGSHKISPSKNKLGSVMSSLVRQCSTDTLKRVNRQFSGSDGLRKSTSDSTLSRIEKPQHARSTSDLGSAYIGNVDLSPESLDHMFLNSPVEPDVAQWKTKSIESENAINTNTEIKEGQPRSVSGLKLQIPFTKRASKSSKNRSDAAEMDDGSVLSSPSSGRSSGHFILHGRKVSVVQTPTNLLDSTLQRDKVVSHPSSFVSDTSASSSTDVYQDAPEDPLSPIN